MKTNKQIYTIHPDLNKRRFIWAKKQSSSCPSVGRSLSDARYLDEIMPRIPDKLHDRLANWTVNYIAASFYSIDSDGEVSKLDIDWDEFNKEGISIATALKKKLGDKVIVRYLKSKLDPSKDMTPLVIE
jgi:hypothetical protein